MARQITGALEVARQVLQSDRAWLFFVEIPVKSPPGPASSFFRMVGNGRHMRANGVLWQAATLSIELPAEDLDGSLGSLRVSVPNVSRLPMAYLEADDYLLGQPLTVYLQNESSMDVFVPALSWTHRILRGKATERRMTIECGHPAEVEQVPMGVYDRFKFPGLLPNEGISLAGA
jgi:hypothetical protein